MNQELLISSLPKKQQVAVIIPCFNEAKRLEARVFTDFIENHNEISFIFVNDGSLDQTIEILRQMAGHISGRIEIIDLPINLGKAEAVRQGINKAISTGFEFVGYLDADLATPLEEIPRLVNVFDRSPEVWLVMGSRVQLLGREIKRRPVRHYLGRIFATVVSIMLKLPVYDTQCGAKFFRNNPATRIVFSQKFVSRWIFDVEIIKRINFISASNNDTTPQNRIYEIPLDKWTEIAGSKLKPRNFLTAIVELFRIHRFEFSVDDVKLDNHLPW